MLHLYNSFFAWKVIGNAVIKHQHAYRYEFILHTPYFDPKHWEID